jgi:hypothetical protein
MATQHITPTEHEKREWSRMATDAYKTGRNAIGHRYSMGACMNAMVRSSGLNRPML